MKVALLARATLYTVKGGDTVQVLQTAKQLNALGIAADIKLVNEKIDYEAYDLLHFFNIIRPADILKHMNRTSKLFVLSPILIDYSAYDKYHRKGMAGIIFRFLSPDRIEYLKTIARWLKGNDKLMSASYLWKGHRGSMKEVLKKASCILSNSDKESKKIIESFGVKSFFLKIPNGIETGLFHPDDTVQKDPTLVLCVARIEGIKNQLSLIKALNNTSFRLLIIGAPSPNQISYYHECRKIAAPNISFINELPQEDLLQYYNKAKVHVLPSWFENCGLSSLEAAAMGCNIVITDKGFASEYFGDMAQYCDPASSVSILEAITVAAKSEPPKKLQEKIFGQYTWQQAAIKTAEAYHKVLNG